jgi:peptidoglycan/xylan/chitin deacetylase (PgdA/CDA1 family)
MLSPFFVSRRVTRAVSFHNPVPDILEETLGVLSPLGPFLPYSQVVTAIQAGHNPPHGTVVIFDDGYKQNMEVLDVLERYSCRAIFFVSTAPLDSDSLLWFMNPDLDSTPREDELRSLPYRDFLRAVDEYGLTRPSGLRGGQGLTSSEVRQIIDRGHEVGIHSHHHPFLTGLTKDEMVEEIGISRERLERAVGDQGPVVDFAYPDGAYNDAVLSVVTGLGLRSACGTDPGTLGRIENLFALPRFVLDDADYAGFALFKLTGLYRTLKTMRANRTHTVSGTSCP